MSWWQVPIKTVLKNTCGQYHRMWNQHTIQKQNTRARATHMKPTHNKKTISPWWGHRCLRCRLNSDPILLPPLCKHMAGDTTCKSTHHTEDSSSDFENSDLLCVMWKRFEQRTRARATHMKPTHNTKTISPWWGHRCLRCRLNSDPILLPPLCKHMAGDTTCKSTHHTEDSSSDFENSDLWCRAPPPVES